MVVKITLLTPTLLSTNSRKLGTVYSTTGATPSQPLPFHPSTSAPSLLPLHLSPIPSTPPPQPHPFHPSSSAPPLPPLLLSSTPSTPPPQPHPFHPSSSAPPLPLFLLSHFPSTPPPQPHPFHPSSSAPPLPPLHLSPSPSTRSLCRPRCHHCSCWLLLACTPGLGSTTDRSPAEHSHHTCTGHMTHM